MHYTIELLVLCVFINIDYAISIFFLHISLQITTIFFCTLPLPWHYLDLFNLLLFFKIIYLSVYLFFAHLAHIYHGSFAYV